MITEQLLSLIRCPECHAKLHGGAAGLHCQKCGQPYAAAGTEYLDLRPKTNFQETTRYLDDALHADGRHKTVSPPLLAAALRNDMLRAFLAPGPGDVVVDLGCGSGRVLVWNRDLGAYSVGIDASPFFASEARAEIDLALGDLRRLPFADGTFSKAYALDVLEHLSRAALESALAEIARILKPGGQLFVYTHVRKNSPLAIGLRGINRLASLLERIGLIDMTQERLRKSDHMNPLADHDDLERVVKTAGFRIERIRYYTPLIGGLIENIFVRMVESAMTRRAHRLRARAGRGPGTADVTRITRAEAKRRIARRGPAYVVLRVITWLMKLDLVLFGRVRSGPFFALLVKQ